MTYQQLDASCTGTSEIISVNISDSHQASTKVATVTAGSTNLDVGDSISIDLGYSGGLIEVFQGYVKMVEHQVPEDFYVITANDVLVRAIDYFMASTNPENPFSRSNISAERLVEDILEEAHLTSFTYEATSFTFGVENPVEVNLTSAYDFCKMIADVLTWTLWADNSGTVHFENRKPYPMDGASGQPGDTVADTSIGTYTDADMLNFSYRKSDRDLRNRVVVYGREGVYASASASSPYLPAGFYKSAVLAWEGIDSNSIAQTAADYNLGMWNRLTEECSMTIPGDPDIECRQVLTVNETYTGVTGDWYIYALDHVWGNQGYTCSMELRR